VRHTWPPKKSAPVLGSLCPDCGTEMLRTTHYVDLPRKDWPLGLGVSIVAQPDEVQA
jgi:hypothetical protein